MTADKTAKGIWRTTILVVFLAIAFGYNEAAVVVYLREIFHSGGFDFPLKEFPIESAKLLLVEIGREAATLVVILSACLIAGKSKQQRAAYFMMIFAVWDIFYYIFLKAIIGWPATMADWDILFLIPMVWAGPVLAPIVISIAMIVFAGVIIYRDYKDKPIRFSKWGMAGFGSAGLIIIGSFCIAGKFTSQQNYKEFFSGWLFAAGMVVSSITFVRCLNKKPPA